jgi:FixJ family two-component response regulator
MPSEDEKQGKKLEAAAQGKPLEGAAEQHRPPDDFLSMSTLCVSERFDGDLPAEATDADEYARSILANAAQPLAVLDESLRVVSASPSFYGAVGCAPGDGLFELAPAARAALSRADGRTSVEIHARRLCLTAREIRGPSGGRRIVLSVEEAGLAEELSAAKAEAERANRMRERILSAANHTLRQPLQTICLIQGMLAASVSNPKDRSLIERLDQGVAAMSEMLDRLLEMERAPVEPRRPEESRQEPGPERRSGQVAETAGAGRDIAVLPARDARRRRVFIVDDDAEIRGIMRDVVERQGYAVSVFADGAEFLEAFTADQAGCLIADAKMPGIGGLQMIERLKAMNAQLSIIVITAYGDIAMAVRAMKAGAMDFLQKPVRQEELLCCIRRACEAAGERSGSSERNEAEARIKGLTSRQRQILELVLSGAPTKTIAADLNLSQRTVDNHRAAIMRKLGAKSLPSLIRIALAGQGVSDAAMALR